MNPKRFWGKDTGEALRFVRSSLGPDALILRTRSVEREHGGGVEITALAEGAMADERVIESGDSPASVSASPIEAVRQELATLKSMLSWLAPELDHKDKIIKALVAQELAPEAISRVSAAMKEVPGTDAGEKIYHALSRLVPAGGQINESRERLALVGPTGVGKTMSLIKLTLLETQRRDCRVAWINADQSRLSGSDSLAVYAGVLGVDYRVAANRSELKRALDQLSDSDVILVDSPGVNPRDPHAIKELAKLFQGIENLRRTLLMSAVTNARDMTGWVENFRGVGIDSVFFTRLDECRAIGPLINTAMSSRCPISYIALGQNLTGDLAIAKPEVFASLLLTGVESHD